MARMFNRRQGLLGLLLAPFAARAAVEIVEEEYASEECYDEGDWEDGFPPAQICLPTPAAWTLGPRPPEQINCRCVIFIPPTDERTRIVAKALIR